MIQVEICIYQNLFLIFMYANIGKIYCNSCTPNRDYVNFELSYDTLKICHNQKCKGYLENLKTYDGCQFGNNRIENKFIVKKYTKYHSYYQSLNSSVCDSDSDGIWKADDCKPVSSYVFRAPHLDSPYEVFVLNCASIPGINTNTNSEIPFSNIQRFQITNYDYFEVFNSTRIKLLPTTKLRCISQCKEYETQAIMQTDDSDIVCSYDTCFISGVKSDNKQANKTVNKNNTKEYVLSCGSINKVSVRFHIINNFEVKIVSLTSGPQRLVNKYDAGEFLMCSVNDSDKNPNYILPTNDLSAYIYFGRFRNDDVEDELTREIPERSISPLHIKCYLGNVRFLGMNHRYWLIQDVYLNITENIRTYLSAAFGNIKSKGEYAYNYPLSTVLFCDYKKYQESAYLLIFTLEKIFYPLSAFQKFAGLEYQTKDKDKDTLTMFTGHTKKLRFASCKFISTKVVTTPVLLFSADRPSLSWWYINPPWETQFQMHKFMVACTGEHVEHLSVNCEDCPKNTTLVNIIGVDDNTVAIEVSEFASAFSYFTIICIGISKSYHDVSIKKKFIIVEANFIGLDRNIRVLQLNKDKFGCNAYFNYFDGGSRIMKIPLMTILVEKQKMIYASSKSQQILITSEHLNPTFEYCCPFFLKNLGHIELSNYTCGNFFKLNVAKKVRVEWNPPLDEIYVGDVLSCHLCATFTDDDSNVQCTDRNRIATMMNIKITYPNETTKFYDSLDRMEMPIVELNPRSKKYYEPSDYKIFATCLTRIDDKLELMIPIHFRSCESHPPPIYIMPQNKTLFQVGEIFSCSTFTDSCKDVLEYSLSIQRGLTNRAFKLRGKSYKFLKSDMGNDIIISCSTGSKHNIEEDRRIIRLEVEPFNISINNNNGMMFYKDYIYCTAGGYPTPDIYWTQFEGPSELRLSEGKILIGPWDMTGTYSFECMAENKLGVRKTSAIFFVYNPRLKYNRLSEHFNLFMPIATVGYILAVFICLLIVFQEGIFGVPFFSSTEKITVILKERYVTEVVKSEEEFTSDNAEKSSLYTNDTNSQNETTQDNEYEYK